MTTSEALNTQDRWNFEAPVAPTLDHSVREDFFNNAPTYTVIELSGDLYRRLPGGNWQHLQELVNVADGYAEYSEHDTSTPERLTCLSDVLDIVRVLRIGEALS